MFIFVCMAALIATVSGNSNGGYSFGARGGSHSRDQVKSLTKCTLDQPDQGGVIPPTIPSLDPPSGNSGYCRGGRNEYVKMSGSCDRYFECIESAEFERTCPDGMYFNPEAPWPQYPCGYPGDVQCTDGVSQPARSTADCPHQYGLFESPYATSTDCGKYRRCVAGVAFEEECPLGLAFNVEKAACDWPSDVASCNAEAFVGFSCPPGSVDENGCDITENFPLPGKCYSFIACHRGNPRLVSCDLGFKFDTSVNRCVNSDLVRTDFQCELRHDRPHICNNDS